MLHAGVRGAQLYVHANGANAGIKMVFCHFHVHTICQMELGCCRMYMYLYMQEANAYMYIVMELCVLLLARLLTCEPMVECGGGAFVHGM